MDQKEDTANVELPEVLIPEEGKQSLRDLFKDITQEVELQVYTEKAATDAYSRFVIKLTAELQSCSDKIKITLLHGDAYKKLPVPAGLPALAIKSGSMPKPFFYMLGAPLGEEGKVLIQSIIIAGTGQTQLSEDALADLAAITEERDLKVFGTGTCPYCPGQMILAASFAYTAPKYITACAIAADQFPELSAQYNVGGVPHTTVNDKYPLVGLLTDKPFASFLKSFDTASLGRYMQALKMDAAPNLASTAEVAPKIAKKMDASAFGGEEQVESISSKEGLKGDVFKADLLVLGGGPAGLAAGIYGGRAGLKVTILDTGALGGQAALTPVIENYPGFSKIKGSKLTDDMAAQAGEYAHIRANLEINNLEVKDGKFIVHSSNGIYSGKALLIATGGSSRKLNIPGEAVFSGRGVHYCASCDGYMYKNKKVFVLGGGSTALTDALHLKNLGIDVTIVHRRDNFRGENALAASVERSKITVLWDSVAVEIKGDKAASSIVIKNVKTNKETMHNVDGVFVAVGYEPNSRPAMAVKAALDQGGNIKIDMHMRTNVPLVYAAGDVTGWGRQVVSAVASGSVAAMSAFEDLQK